MKEVILIMLIVLCSSFAAFSQDSLKILGKWKIVDAYCILDYRDTIKRSLYSKTISKAKLNTKNYTASYEIVDSGLYIFLKNGEYKYNGFTQKNKWVIQNDSLILGEDEKYIILYSDETLMIFGSHNRPIIILNVLKKDYYDLPENNIDMDEYYILPYLKQFIAKMKITAIICE